MAYTLIEIGKIVCLCDLTNDSMTYSNLIDILIEDKRLYSKDEFIEALTMLEKSKFYI